MIWWYHAKSILQINELKEFQIKAISAVREGKDVVVVQPTGSGKSTCYTLPALLYSRKVAIIIEPVVAIITNQVDALAKKGVDAVALGRAAALQKRCICICAINIKCVAHIVNYMPLGYVVD